MDENNPAVTPPITPSGPQSVQPTPQPPQPPTASNAGKNPFFSFWFWGPLIFILNAAAIYWFLVYPRLGNFIDIPTGQQILSRQVHVNKVAVKEYASLIIERSSQDLGIGSRLAETGMLWPGTYKDFDLRLIVDEALTDDDLLREITPGVVYATLYKDVDKDRFFNPDIDTEPVRDLFGNPVRVEFVIQ